ncbi:glutathione peroxidase [Peribacillus sp. SCS-37]|uniref:glutathione peroxidase n=1 Tax=Paraperibacillus esterisolvens TaxID=3115296 RepID=UPI0039061A29
MGIYQLEAKSIEGQTISMDSYKDQVLLIVNTASKCGFTPQFSELESLYEKYKEQGFAVLGFPCNQFMGQEPGDEMEIQSFCQLTYGVSFPMFSKVDVKGDQAHPLFQYLTEHAPGVLGSKSIKWNFTKFLVDRSGNIVKRYAPQTKPNEIEKEIQSLL